MSSGLSCRVYFILYDRMQSKIMTDFSLKKFWTGKIACSGYLSFNGTFVYSLLPALYGYGVFCKALIISSDFLLSVAPVPVFRTVATLC